ncbi:MAG: sensor histidine kinase [Candidatus Dormibacteraceae bacterium]
MGLVHRVLGWRPPYNGPGAGLLWSTIWLAYLVIPMVGIWTSELALGTRLLMSGMIVGFAACYVGFWAFVILSSHWRHRGYAAAVVLAVGVIAAVVGGQYGLGYALCYAAAAVGVAFVPRFRVAFAAVIGTAVLAVLIGVLTRMPSWELVLEGMIVLSGGGGALGYIALDMQNDRLRQAHEEIARLAVAEERLRFSRDLHDLLGHSLSVIVLKAELAHRMAARSPERTVKEVADIEEVAREALREVRDAVAGYRQPNLSAELESAAQTLRGAGLQVQVAGGAGALPGALDGALAWTVREATTNVIRHARARRVRFEIARDAARVRLKVANDGTAATEGAGPGNGLRGLKERLHALGGELRYGPGPVDGFTLTAILPLSPSGEAAAAIPSIA